MGKYRTTVVGGSQKFWDKDIEFYEKFEVSRTGRNSECETPWSTHTCIIYTYEKEDNWTDESSNKISDFKT